jgi:hypothetical protein
MGFTKRFDFKGLLQDRDALTARLELAFVLERRPKLRVPAPAPAASEAPPPSPKADKR